MSADHVNLGRDLVFTFDGAEGIGFWVTDPELEDGRKVPIDDVPKLVGFLRHWFPGAFRDLERHVQATTVRALQGAFQELIRDLDDLMPKEEPTHEERIRTAAAALPGITEEQLSLWYDEQLFDRGMTT